MTTWSAVYREDTGELVSVGTTVADPLPDGLAAVEVDGPQELREWDTTAHEFGPAPEPDPSP